MEWHRFPDGLAAACEAVVKVWKQDEPADEVKVNEGTNVFALDFSPNNKVLAVGGDKGQITLYSSTPQSSGNRAVGYLPPVPDGSVDAVTCLRFLPDTSLVAGCKNGAVLQWELRHQPQSAPRAYRGLTGSATALAVPHARSLLAAASSSGQVLLFDLKTATRVQALQKEGGATPAGQLAFSRLQPGLLAAGNAAGQLLLWDLEQVSHVARPAAFQAHQGAVTGLVFSESDPALIISCGADGRLRGHDTRSHQMCWSVSAQYGLTSLAAKWDGRLLAVGGADGSVSVQDVRHIKTVMTVQHFSDARPVTGLAWFNPLKGTIRPSAPPAAATPAATPAAASTHTQQQAAKQQQSAAAGAMVTPPAAGGLRSEPSNGSLCADAGMRAMSPVAVYGCSSDADLAATAAAAAAAGAAALRTPELGSLATPGDSCGLSGGGLAGFMLTPGIGLPAGAFGAVTPECPSAAAGGGGGGSEPTPISRPTAVRPAVAGAAGAAAGPGGSSSILGAGADAAAALTGPSKQRSVSGASRGTEASSKPAPAGPTGAGAGSRGPASRSNSSSGLSAAAAAAPTPAAAAAAGSKGGSGAPGTPGRAPGGRGGPGAAGQPGAAAAAAGGSPAGSRSRRGSRAELPDVSTAAAAGADGSSRPSSAGSAGGGIGSGPGGPGLLAAAREAAAGGIVLGAAGGVGAGAGALREDVFRAYVDQQMEEVRADVRALHLDMLRQFHQAQMDLVSVVDGLAQRQDQLADAVAALAAAVVAGGKGQQAQRPAPGCVGLLPWM